MGNYFSGIFARSPVNPLQNHMAKVQAAISELEALFEATIEGDFNTANATRDRIVELEHEADVLKKELRLHLPKGMFLPVARGDILNILSVQDRIANRSKDIAGIVTNRRITIPEPIAADFMQLLRRSVDASNQAQVAINELDELVETGFRGGEVKLVEKMLNELDEIEGDTDRLEREIQQKLFEIETTLPPVEVVFLYQLVDWVGDLADLAQQVGNRLQLMLAR